MSSGIHCLAVFFQTYFVRYFVSDVFCPQYFQMCLAGNFNSYLFSDVLLSDNILS